MIKQQFNLTNILLFIILFILVKQFYPDIARNLITIGVIVLLLYGGYWLVMEFPAERRKHRARKKQELQDEKDFLEYDKQSSAVRTKYDPENKWNETTSVPDEYLEEIRKLNFKYRGMLQRRNGWTAEDFDDY